jgi:hypothetical protein
MSVSALLVSTKRRGPGQLQGLEGFDGLGIGDATNLLDTLTSGEYSSRIAQLDRLELALKISIVASCVAGIAGLAVLMRGRG